MVKNLERVKRMLARWPARVKDRLDKRLQKEAADLAAAVQRAAPVDETSDDPGALRDSVHVERGKRELSYFVVVDAKDEQGRPFAKNVETGHRAQDGSHVPARPFAYPTYRARKPGMRRRIRADAVDEVKKIIAEG